MDRKTTASRSCSQYSNKEVNQLLIIFSHSHVIGMCLLYHFSTIQHIFTKIIIQGGDYDANSDLTMLI